MARGAKRRFSDQERVLRKRDRERERLSMKRQAKKAAQIAAPASSSLPINPLDSLPPPLVTPAPLVQYRSGSRNSSPTPSESTFRGTEQSLSPLRQQNDLRGDEIFEPIYRQLMRQRLASYTPSIGSASMSVSLDGCETFPPGPSSPARSLLMADDSPDWSDCDMAGPSGTDTADLEVDSPRRADLRGGQDHYGITDSTISDSSKSGTEDPTHSRHPSQSPPQSQFAGQGDEFHSGRNSPNIPNHGMDIDHPLSLSSPMGSDGGSDVGLVHPSKTLWPSSASIELDKSIRFLAEQLVQFKGCSSDTHIEEELEFQREARGEPGQSIPIGELGSIRMEFLGVDVLAVEGLVGAQEFLAHPDDVKRAFTGIFWDDSPKPAKLSLLSESKPLSTFLMDCSFDVDSFVAEPVSLAVSSEGLMVNFYPNQSRNLKATLHIKTPVMSNGKSKLVSYHVIPHFSLGSFVKDTAFEMYIFFPALYREEAQSNRLTEHNLERFVDKVLLPAVYEVFPSRNLQGFPGSFQHAKRNALAAHLEPRIQKVNKSGRVSTLRHILPASCLHKLWECILEMLFEPGLGDFGTPILLVSAKNMKGRKSGRSFSETVAAFEKELNKSLNWDFLSKNRAWVDIGKGYVDKRSLYGTGADIEVEKDECGTTFLWKNCCLKQFVKEIRFNEERKGEESTYYPWSMTRDTGNLTIEPSRNNPFREAGLAYIQMYSKTKEIFDAAKIFPFSNDRLEGLALDPKFRAAVQEAGGSWGWDYGTALEAYTSSKGRINAGLEGARWKSFGVREEYRMTLGLCGSIAGMVDLLLEDHEGFPLDPPNLPFFVHPTSDICVFLRSHIGQYAYGFEYVLATGGLSNGFERSRVLTMFLRCLRLSIGAPLLQTESSLWIDSWKNKPLEGLGFRRSMDDTGYCFLPEEKIDWDTWVFSKDHVNKMMFSRNAFLDSFGQRRPAVDSITEKFELISGLAQLFTSAGRNYRARKALCHYMAVILIKCYRKEFWAAHRDSIREEYMEHAMAGNVAPTFSSLRMLVGMNPNEEIELVKRCNRWDIKPLEKVKILWEFDDRQQRRHWENKPFRLLYRYAISQLAEHLEPDRVERWREMFYFKFLRHNWLLPSVTAELFMSNKKNSGGTRLYYFAQHPEMGAAGEQFEQSVQGRPDPPQSWVLPAQKLTTFEWNEEKNWSQGFGEGKCGILEAREMWLQGYSMAQFLELFADLLQ